MKIELSKHAETRQQQRGVQAAAISFVANHGKRTRTNNGCIKAHFDKGCLRKIKYDKEINNLYRQNDQQINKLVLIMNPFSGKVVTVMHVNQSKKIRWN